MSAHKGVEGGGVEGGGVGVAGGRGVEVAGGRGVEVWAVGWRCGPWGGGVGRGVEGGQRIDLKMEADHDWSPKRRLHGCAGSLVANMTEKCLANIIRLCTSKSLVVVKPGPSQGLKPPLKLYTPPRKDIC